VASVTRGTAVVDMERLLGAVGYEREVSRPRLRRRTTEPR
jgi:hypothetical protein